MDCLVLKLKGVVDDELLLRPDEMLVQVISTETTKLNVKVPANETLVFTLLGSSGVFVATSTNTIEVPTTAYQSMNITTTAGDGYIKISNKHYPYGWNEPKGIKVNIEDFAYIDEVTNLTLLNSYGDLSKLLKKSSLGKLRLGTYNIMSDCYGDITDLFNKFHISDLSIHGTTNISADVNSFNFSAVENKTSFVIYNISTSAYNLSLLNGYPTISISGTNVIGDINDLTDTNITFLQLSRTAVTGNLNEWLDDLYNAGKRTNLTLYMENAPNLTWTGSGTKAEMFIEFNDSGWQRVSSFS